MFAIVMQKRFKPAAFVWLASLFMAAMAAMAATGCASVPPFEPSQPLEQVKSLHEGLLLCNEYQLPSDDGRRRPVTLRPFLACLDQVATRFPDAAQGYDAFQVFHQEFWRNYRTLSDTTWTPRQGVEIEVSVHAALRALWQEGTPWVTPLERELVLRNFPLASKRMGAERWLVSTSVTFDPRLEALKAGLASLSEDGGLGQGSAARVSADQSADLGFLCRDYSKLKKEIGYLSDLWRDQYDFALLAPQSPLTAEVRARYRRRLDAALRDLEALRPRIAEARAKESFRVLACQP